MRNLFPGLFVLWGAAIVLRTFVVGTNGTGAYASGQLIAALFGVGLIVVGVRHMRSARQSA